MQKHFQAPWSLKEVILILLGSIILLFCGGLGAYFLGLIETINNSPHKGLYLTLGFLVQWVLILLPLIVVTAIKHKLKWKNFGFKKVGLLKTLGLVLWGYFIFFAITVAVTILIVFADFKIPGYQIQEQILPLFGNGALSLILAAIVMILLVPIVEEIFFRGFLLRSLANKIQIFWASTISATLFALAHLQLQNIIPLFILGLIMNSLVIKSKSIWPSIAFHMVNNSIALTIEILFFLPG